MDDPQQYVFKPWPNDALNYLSDFAVSYVTPATSVGLGTELGLASGRLPTYGLVSLHLDSEPYLYGLAIRLEERDRQLYAPILVAQIAAMSATAQQQSPAFGRDAQPYELTSRGGIGASVTEAYKAAIEACSRGPAGNAPHGSLFVACLRQQIQKESAGCLTSAQRRARSRGCGERRARGCSFKPRIARLQEMLLHQNTLKNFSMTVSCVVP
jgi:hypothetical protein